MVNPQLVSDRIKQRAKDLNVPLGKMLSDLNLGVNTVSQMATGKGVSYLIIESIADYLNCSVDYLLGKSCYVTSTTNPDIVTVNAKVVKLSKDQLGKVIGYIDSMLDET